MRPFAICLGALGLSVATLSCAGRTSAPPPNAPSDSAAAESETTPHSEPEHPMHGGEHGKHGKHGHGEHTMHRGEHGSMHHRFDDAEAWAEAFDDPARDEWQRPDAVIAKLALPADAAVADVGAGTGYFTMRFARAVPSGRVLASDIEPDMVRYLGERSKKESLSNVTPIEGQPSDPALSANVDVLFMCNTYHHVADRTVYFATAASYLAPGGRVVIVDFKVDAPDDAPGPPKKHRIAPAQVIEELAAAGYRHVETDETLLPYQYIAIFDRA